MALLILLMPPFPHLSAVSLPLKSCIFASNLHPFMCHLSLLTPLTGSQASRVLEISSTLPHFTTFSSLAPTPYSSRVVRSFVR